MFEGVNFVHVGVAAIVSGGAVFVACCVYGFMAMGGVDDE